MRGIRSVVALALVAMAAAVVNVQGAAQPPDELEVRKQAVFRFPKFVKDDWQPGRIGKLTLAFSSDGKRLGALATYYRGKFSPKVLVKICSVETGKELLAFPETGSHFTVPRLAFSTDGQIVAAHVEDTVKVWNVATGKTQAVFLGGNAFALAPDGKWLATVNYRRILYKPIGGEGIIITPTSAPLSGPFGKFDNYRYFPAVTMWDLRTKKELAHWKGWRFDYAQIQIHLAFSPDSKKLAIGSDGEVILWDFGRNHQMIFDAGFRPERPKHGKSRRDPLADLRPLGFLVDGKTLVSCGHLRREVLPKKSADPAQPSNAPLQPGALPGSSRMVLEPAITFWDLTEAKEQATRTMPSLDIAIALKGNILASPEFQKNGKKDLVVKLRDLAKGEVIATIKTEGFGLALSPDGRRLATGDKEGRVIVWTLGHSKKRLR